MSETYDVFSVAELSELSVRCVCGAEMIFQASTENVIPGETKCPSCRNDVPEQLLNDYRQFYRAAVKHGSGKVIRLRVKRPS